MSGVTDEGFEAETLDTLKTAVEGELKNAFGASFNVRPTSVAGILIGIFSQKIADVWEAAEAVYNSQYPETAFGSSLDQLGVLTGTQRLPAERSVATVSITADVGTVIPVGSRIRNSATQSLWRLREDEGDVTVPGAGYTTAFFESEDFGEVLGLAGDLDTIDTVISGWDAVNNSTDAELGRLVETDAAYRIRREERLASQGKGTFDAIRADVLAVNGVLEAYVFENVTLITDGTGLPGKAFEVVLRDGGVTPSDVYQAIWDSKPVGISAYGTQVGLAYDSLENAHYVAYTPATEIPIYVSLTAITGAGFPSASDAGILAIKSAVTAYGDALLIGNDVVRIKIIAAVQGVQGVADHSNTTLDVFASPTATTNISIGSREVADFDTSRVVVTLL